MCSTIGTPRATIKHSKMEAVVIQVYASRGIGTETCGMDYMFPSDDLWSGLNNDNNCTCTVFFIYIYIYY